MNKHQVDQKIDRRDLRRKRATHLSLLPQQLTQSDWTFSHEADSELSHQHIHPTTRITAVCISTAADLVMHCQRMQGHFTELLTY